MKWRKQYNVDNILDWKTPQLLANYTPHGISGFDKEGSPGNLPKFKQQFLFFFLLYLLPSLSPINQIHSHRYTSRECQDIELRYGYDGNVEDGVE